MIDYDGMALKYASHRRVNPEVLDALLATSGVGRDSDVLEVGCGTGNYIVALEARADCSCWGIDPSEQMLSQARERSGKVQFQPGTAESTGFPPDSFDLLFSVDVIHHVGDRLAHFQEAYRVVKAGGRVCTVTDSEWIMRHRQPLAVYFPETVEAELARYPSIAELRDLMHQAGFHETAERMVELPYQLTDARPFLDKAFSALHLISEDAFQRGIERMEEDLRAGPIECVSRYVLLWGTK